MQRVWPYKFRARALRWSGEETLLPQKISRYSSSSIVPSVLNDARLLILACILVSEHKEKLDGSLDLIRLC